MAPPVADGADFGVVDAGAAYSAALKSVKLMDVRTRLASDDVVRFVHEEMPRISLTAALAMELLIWLHLF